MNTLTWISVFLIFIIPVQLFSQSKTNEGNYTVQYFNTDNGLPQNTINGIEQDEFGYIWLATQSGLIRWDGINFEKKQLKQEDKTKITNQRALGFTRNHKKELLVVYNNWVTKKIVNNDFESCEEKAFINTTFGVEGYFLNKTVDTSSPHFRDFYRNSYNFFVTKNKEAYRIVASGIFFNDSVSIQKIKAPKLTSASIFIHDSLFYVDSSSKTYAIKKGKPALVTTFWKFENNTTVPASLLLSARVFHRINADPLILLKNKLYKVIRTGNYFNLIFITQINHEDVYCFYYRKSDDSYFVGTSSNGLIVIKKNKFKVVHNQGIKINSETPQVIRDNYYSQVLLKDNSIITFGGIGFKQSSESFKSKEEIFYTSFTDNKNDLWVALLGVGIKHYNNNFKLLNYITTPFYVIDICQDNANRIWVTSFKAIAGIDNNKLLPEIKLPLENNNFAECIFSLNDTTLWIGTQTGVLAYNKKQKTFSSVPGLEGYYARRIIWDKSKTNIWILTYGQGLLLYRNNVFTAFPLDKNKYLQYANIVHEDNNGIVWLFTNHGIFSTTKEVLLKYAEKKTSAVFYFSWAKQPGLSSTEFNGGSRPAYVKMTDGTISAPTMNGLLWFTPENINASFSKTPVFVDKVFVNNQVEEKIQNLRIKNNVEQIKLIISTPHWSDPDNLQLEYKFANQKQWYPVNNNEIILNNISSGKKTVHIRRRTGFNNSDFTVTDFTFYVEKKWYETALFMASVIILFFLLIIGIIKLRERSSEKRKAFLENEIAIRSKELRDSYELMKSTSDINEMLLSVISHDVRAPLKFSGEILDELQFNLEQISETEKLYLITELNKSNRELQKYTNQITTWTKLKQNTLKINVTKINTQVLLTDIINYFTQTSLIRTNEIINSSTPDCFVKTDKTLLEILLHNVIDNACKYTTNGTIDISTYIKESNFYFICKDNGKGMSEEELRTILTNEKLTTAATEISYKLGYLFINLIALTLKAKIDIDSTPGKGTSVTISLPINNL